MITHDIRVDAFSHYFKVTAVQAIARHGLNEFIRRQIQMGLKRVGRKFVKVPVKVYGASTKDRSEYRFHINQWADFKRHMAQHGIREERMLVEVHVPKPGRKVDLKINAEYIPREDQVPVINFIKTPSRADVFPRRRNKLVPIQTGKGKSLCLMQAMSDVSGLMVLMVRPMYIEKWVLDMERTFSNVKAEDVMVVQGSASLAALLRMQTDGTLAKVAKVILMSNKTIQNFIKEYEEQGELLRLQGYDCLPDELCQYLEASWKVVDEIHQDFHLNFKIDLYTHVEEGVGLTATLISDDAFVEKQQNIMFPPDTRYQGGELDRYIASRAVKFSLEFPRKVQCTEWGTGRYSHVKFEDSIMSNAKLLHAYNEMAVSLLARRFMRPDFYKKGDKAIIFVATIAYATKLTAYIASRFPNLSVRRYVEEDPFIENCLEPDIRVSTIQSAGTAIDIPQLTYTLLTQALSSSSSNIQTLGRLRKLKDDRIPEFDYYFCEDIPKHIEYHIKKKEMLQDRADSYAIVDMGMLKM